LDSRRLAPERAARRG